MAKSHKTCMKQAEIIDTFGTYQDHIQITIREWIQPKDSTISFLCDTMKDKLWNMLMHNFLLRMPEVALVTTL